MELLSPKLETILMTTNMFRHYIPSIAAMIALSFVIVAATFPFQPKADVTSAATGVIGNAFSSLPSGVCIEPPSDMTNWWDADNISGTTARDFLGAADGLLSSGATTAPGKVHNAFRFPGPSFNSNGSRIDRSGGFIGLPRNFFPYPVSGRSDTPFTIEFWFNVAPGDSGVMFGQQGQSPYNSVGGYVPGVWITLAGTVGMEMFWGGGRRIESNRSVTDAQWHHLAVVFDGTSETLFIDGANVGSMTFEQRAYRGGYDYNFGTGVSHGRRNSPGGWHAFKGMMDEISLYSRALSSDEIGGIHNAGEFGKCKLECNNNLIQQGEVCDGVELAGQTCETVAGIGYTGTLACANNCLGYDTSGCIAPKACSDGIDNDGDGAIDFPNDQGCSSADDDNEVNPTCIDLIDNDGDGLIDFPADPGCTDAHDDDETDPPTPRTVLLKKNSKPIIILEPALNLREFISLSTNCATCDILPDPDPRNILGGTAEADEGFVTRVQLFDTVDNTFSHIIIAVGDFELQTRVFNDDGMEYSGIGEDPDTQYLPSFLADGDNEYYFKVRQGTRFESLDVTPYILPINNRTDLKNSELTYYLLAGEDSSGKGHLMLTKGRIWIVSSLGISDDNPPELYTFFQSRGDIDDCIQALENYPDNHMLLETPSDFQLMLDMMSLCQR